MINFIVNEYSLVLRTGESLPISEIVIDESYRQELISIINNKTPPLEWVPVVTASVIEEAKRGYDKELLKLLGTPPEAALLRVPSKLCFQRKICASYIYEQCLLKPQKKRDKKSFPVCWEYDIDKEMERSLITFIVYQWREGRRVIIVD